ncbi:endolytic transglycosylase MltG [Desulfofustis limnaeus]|jgi:UPF0755 protein|uniref:Endolytic murein transglycosylase n=1 Tax=Desulfofustis limnaeus TaxID=2740163 RepID=A0ABN6M4L5_9BACT|nr:endolytic transglycosylase MltG [Desulfofustis limnaeus]MDX9897259.1 endolytic transglycosylase MltG [Desulfofustis sp.]BDD86820.1 aminodeoxychorismate lyase [Desulfofustis limnaeus]
MIKRIVIILLGLLLLTAVGLAGWLLSYTLRPGPPSTEPTAVVFIERGSSVAEIGRVLAAAGLVHEDRRFLVVTRLSGLASRLPAGEFVLPTGLRPLELIRALAVASPLEHQITIPEGLNLVEIAALFADAGWVDRDRFLALARDPVLAVALGLGDVASLEGYLFPDSYRLTRPAPDERLLLERLVTRSLKVWEKLTAEHDLPPDLDRHQVFTLAAIVEKEAARAEERSLIAGVFLNRLERGMRLQSDPTVIYGLPDFSGRLTRSDLQTPTPYNTYVIAGLPPGPICSPGEASLRAVLQPAATDYLYFVAKNDGTHHFSTNLREHNRAVQQYQRGR